MDLPWRTHWSTNVHQYALIDPPVHPTYDLYAAVRAALAEDAGDLGDITTLSTVPEKTQATATFLAKRTGSLPACTSPPSCLTWLTPR